MLEKLLALLGDGANAAAAEFCLDDCTHLALDYCNLDVLPAGLESTVVRMAVDLYRLQGYGQEAAPEGPVTAVKEGDQSISYAADRAGAIAGAGAALLTNYAVRLNAYRKLRW